MKLIKNIASIADVKNETRPVLGGVLIDNVKMCATDSFKLIQVKHEKPRPEFNKPLVLDAKEIKKGIKINKSTAAVEITPAGNSARVTVIDPKKPIQQVTIPLIDEDYPAVEQITNILDEKPEAEIVVTAGLLIDVLKCYGPDGLVKIGFHGKEKPLTFKTYQIHKTKPMIEGLLMPVKS